MTEVLNGNVLARNIRDKAAQRIADLPTPPGLAVILVGDDPASHLYVGLKERAAKDVGIYIEKFLFAADVSDDELVTKIQELNARNDIHGILVQLPLPGGQNVDKVIAAIDYKKDVDGFHPENRKLLAASKPILVPPVALAIMRMLQATRAPLASRSAVVVGNSAIFAEPVLELMKETGVTATFVKSNETAIAAKTRAADIIVVAVGEPNFITRDMVKDGAIVIDVGTNKVDGKVVGDAAADLMGHAAFMSKVPGGVGPLTVAYLLFNVIKAMEIQGRE